MLCYVFSYYAEEKFVRPVKVLQDQSQIVDVTGPTGKK